MDKLRKLEIASEQHPDKVIRNAVKLALEMLEDDEDGKYYCPNCDWQGHYIELIQAGPISELCPECETLITEHSS